MLAEFGRSPSSTILRVLLLGGSKRPDLTQPGTTHSIHGISVRRPDGRCNDESCLRLQRAHMLQTDYWEKRSMKTRLASLLPLAGLGLVLLAGELATAGDKPVKESYESKDDGLPGLISAVSRLPMPNLSGLIKPEKMGLLTDNQCRIQDNEAHLLSDNETDVTLLSGNKVSILSGVRLLSGITINVHVTIHDPDAKASKPKNGHRRRDSKKSKRHKAARKTKRS